MDTLRVDKSEKKLPHSYTDRGNGNCCQIFFWQAVWQYVPGALKTSLLLPHLLEIHVEIFMNEIMYAWDLLQNNPRERVIGTFCR